MNLLGFILKWFRNLTKPEDKSYLVEDDGTETQKNMIASMNDISSKIKENKRDFFDSRNFYLMLFIALGTLLQERNLVLILGIFLMMIFMRKTIAFYRRRLELANDKKIIFKRAKEMGILKKQIK